MIWSLFRHFKHFWQNQTCSDSVLIWHGTWFLFFFFFSWSALFTVGVCCPSVRGGWGGMSLGRWGQMPALSEPAALSLSPCCPVSRCWPEEAPAQWTPQREGELGGSTAGCALPLNFQHRSVQERMSTPSSSLPHHPLHADDKEKNAPSYSLRRSLLFIQYISGAKHLKEPNSVPFE